MIDTLRILTVIGRSTALSGLLVSVFFPSQLDAYCQAQKFSYEVAEPLVKSQSSPTRQAAPRPTKLNIIAHQFLPQPTARPAPIVLFNHGGISGLVDNSKRRAKELCERGFAVFASSYRGEDGSEGEIEVAAGEVRDVLALLDWIKTRSGRNAFAKGASQLAIDPNRVALLGFSHGALISLQAAKQQPRDFKVMVFAYGVADLYRWVEHLRNSGQFGADPLTQKIYGSGPNDKPENYALRFGLANIERIDPKLKTLIVQGKRDTLVPWQQAQALQQALQKAGRHQETHYFQHATHAFLIRREALSGKEKRDADLAWLKIYEFLNAHLQEQNL